MLTTQSCVKVMCQRFWTFRISAGWLEKNVVKILASRKLQYTKASLKSVKLTRKRKSSGIKMKEIVHEAINHFGNPWAGVRAFALKQYLGIQHFRLTLSQAPQEITDMGVLVQPIELVKGIGMAGYYRLPGAKPPFSDKT
ncbi:hypothetical protein Btru_073053 [Bulinus truncatus]|nr:hypothetical protein Btru_073053 [Bulinus truncatus]